MLFQNIEKKWKEVDLCRAQLCFHIFQKGRKMKMVGDARLKLLVSSCVDSWAATGGLVAPARGR